MRVKEVDVVDCEVQRGFAVQKRVVSFLPIYENDLVFAKREEAEDYIITHK